MQKNFWHKRVVVVTGAAGFVGSHLITYLKKRGAQTIGISRGGQKQGVIKLDVADQKALFQLIKRTKPFAIFHLAADALVEEGEEKPYETIRNNIISSLNILEAARRYKIARVVIASTVHVYGDAPSPFHEDDPPRPSRPYETSKTCVDIIAQSYADTFHLPVLIPRFVNIYGPGDTNMARLIPKTITTILTGKSPRLWGGQVAREYLYIDDVLRAYDTLAQLSDAAIERNRIFNFGADQTIAVAQVIQMLLAITKSSLPITLIQAERAREVATRRVSWQKAKQILGWEPTVALQVGLKKTVEWYRRHLVDRS